MLQCQGVRKGHEMLGVLLKNSSLKHHGMLQSKVPEQKTSKKLGNHEPEKSQEKT